LTDLLDEQPAAADGAETRDESPKAPEPGPQKPTASAASADLENKDQENKDQKDKGQDSGESGGQ